MALFGGKEKEVRTPREIFGPQIEEFLLPNEEIEEIYGLVFDFMCLTNKRLIFVDKELSFKEPKTTIFSYPFDKITGVGLEKNEKVLAFTDELIIVTKGKIHDLKFIKGTNIKEVYNKLVEKII